MQGIRRQLEMGHRNERIGFRFLKLSHSDAEHLSKFAEEPTVRLKKGTSDEYVLSFWMRDDGKYDWLIDLIRARGFSEEDYGFFVSLVTERDSDGVSLPEFARKLFRQTGGRMDFSFTFVTDEDEK